MGDFRTITVLSNCVKPVTLLSWNSEGNATGLWACPTSPRQPGSGKVLLKASTAKFQGLGCVAIDGIQIEEAGDDFAAWSYT